VARHHLEIPAKTNRLQLASQLLNGRPMRSAHPRPLVSLVLVTCDQPERLARAVESVLGQRYENLELVVVNDGGGATDHVLEALDRRGRTVHLRLPHRRGRAAALNHGLRVARGEYVGFLDEHDALDPHHVATLVAALGASDHLIGRALARRRIEKEDGGTYVVLREEAPFPAAPRAPTLATLLRDNPLPLASVLVHRRCLEEVGAFDDSLGALEDWDLWLRVARRFPFLAVDAVTSTSVLRLDMLAQTRWRHRLAAARSVFGRHADVVEADPDLREAKARLLGNLERAAATHAPRVSVVAPLRSEHPGYVRGFLHQLAETTRAFDVELLVMDRGLAPAAAAEANAIASRVVRVGGPLGPVLGEAARLALGETLVLVRGDVLLEEGWLHGLERHACDDGPIVGGLTLDPDGRVAHAGLVFEGSEAAARPLFRGIEATAAELCLPRDLDAIAPGAIRLPRDLARAVGFGVQDGWGAIAEACLEARRRGARVRLAPDSVAYRIPRGHALPWLTVRELAKLSAIVRGDPPEAQADAAPSTTPSKDVTETSLAERDEDTSTAKGPRPPVVAA